MTATIGAHAPICLDCGRYVAFCHCQKGTKMPVLRNEGTETIHRTEQHDVSFAIPTARLHDALAIVADLMRQHPERTYTTLEVHRSYPAWNVKAHWSEYVASMAPAVQPQECQGCGELTTNFSCWCDACQDADI